MVRIFRFKLVLFYIYINRTNIPPIMIINRICMYETQNLLSLQLVSFLVGLRTYQHPCKSEVKAIVTCFKAVCIGKKFCFPRKYNLSIQWHRSRHGVATDRKGNYAIQRSSRTHNDSCSTLEEKRIQPTCPPTEQAN